MVNRIIASLPRSESKRLLERCERVDLAFGDILSEADQPFTHAYFPLSGFVSVTEKVKNHQPLEIGLIGHEGMLGATLVLGNGSAATNSIVQGSGTALRITVSQLWLELSKSPILLRTLQQYLYVILTQLSQSTACLHFHRIQPRLGRWLLMMHDRAHVDHFHLTHECVANMLGVRRSGITVAAGALQKMNLIQYSRGEIQILDRKGLEDVSCECYATMLNNYARQLG